MIAEPNQGANFSTFMESVPESIAEAPEIVANNYLTLAPGKSLQVPSSNRIDLRGIRKSSSIGVPAGISPGKRTLPPGTPRARPSSHNSNVKVLVRVRPPNMAESVFEPVFDILSV